MTSAFRRDYKRNSAILDRVVNGAHHVAMPGRSYRPNRRPGAKAGS